MDFGRRGRHANLSHESVLVAVHPGELADVGEDVLEAVGELKGVDVPEAVLDDGIDDELGQPEDLATARRRKMREEKNETYQRWNAFPKRDFLRSLVVKVFTGLRLKL